jgi:hypothetical protein
MFELPQKSDLDRRLSELMHENRRKLTEECDLIKNKAGSLRGTPLIVGIAAKKADQLHRDAITQAAAILLDFIERMKRPPVEIVGWVNRSWLLCRRMTHQRIIEASLSRIVLFSSNALMACYVMSKLASLRERASPELRRWKLKKNGAAPPRQCNS